METETTSPPLAIDDLAINPFKFELVLSSWISIPSYVFLVLFSTLMIYVVLKHFRPILKIYLSVLLYLLSQLLLLVTISASWLVEYLEPDETMQRCKKKLPCQTFAMLLPGYSIVLITAVRSIFLKFPLSFSSYLKIRYQLIGFGIAAMICALISAAPILGLSEVQLHKQGISGTADQGPSQISYCSFGKMSDPAGKAFYGILLGIGFILPIVTVVVLYIFIYNIVVSARASHKNLTKSSTSLASTVTTKEDTNAHGAIKRRCSKAMKEKEQRTFPWSILAILGVCITTTLPWAGIIVFTVEITEALLEKGSLSIWFDVFYSVLQILIGCSPLVYMQTTRSLRNIITRMATNLITCYSI